MRVGIDTGGTFTDCVYFEHGVLRVLKLFSTPRDPAEAIQTAVAQIIPENESAEVLHGTTVGTNTLLERKGARVAFITTAGFEDTLGIGRQNRPRLYDLFATPPPPLVPAEMRFGVRERIAPDGSVVEPLAADELQRLRDAVAASQPEAVAVSLLFSFVNPAHERAVAEALATLGVPVSVSHQVLPEFREYERASTLAVNAYLSPRMSRYIGALGEWLTARSGSIWSAGVGTPERKEHALGAPRVSPAPGLRLASPLGRQDAGAPYNAKSTVRIMQSSGGITTAAVAAREPVRTVLSGPAGGVVGAASVARQAGFERIITFDMGGTSTDVALVEGQPRTSGEGTVAGLPVAVPMLDIHTVGAGGGSLARFDAGGALRVGPESAGADPGPICYGRGELPTVTDANLLLGRLHPDFFLGGEVRLDEARARQFFERFLKGQYPAGARASSPATLTGYPSGLGPRASRPHFTGGIEAFAEGIVRVANASMEKAIRVISIERGYDPRDFTLVSFGGAGGLHACALAAALRIPRVLVPLHPGALSALGILLSDVVKDYSRTVMLAPGDRSLAKRFAEIERVGRDEMRREGFSRGLEIARSADLRYVGQGYEINVPWISDRAATGDPPFEGPSRRKRGLAPQRVGHPISREGAVPGSDRAATEVRHGGREGAVPGQAADKQEASDAGFQVAEAFHRAHETRYGYADAARPVEVVNIRVRLRAPSEARASRSKGADALDGARPRRGQRARPAVGRDNGRQALAKNAGGRYPLYQRERLVPGDRFTGPAIIAEYSATTFLPAGFRAAVDTLGHMILEPQSSDCVPRFIGPETKHSVRARAAYGAPASVPAGPLTEST